MLSPVRMVKSYLSERFCTSSYNDNDDDNDDNGDDARGGGGTEIITRMSIGNPIPKTMV